MSDEELGMIKNILLHSIFLEFEFDDYCGSDIDEIDDAELIVQNLFYEAEDDRLMSPSLVIDLFLISF